MNITLVPLTEEYVELIRRWRNADRATFMDTREVTKAQQLLWFDTYRNEGGDHQYVILLDGDPVGTLAVIDGVDFIILKRVMLGRKDMVRRGVMTHAIQQLLGRYHGKAVRLNVKSTNTPAVQLYLRCGFSIESIDGDLIKMKYTAVIAPTPLAAARRFGFEVADALQVDSVCFDETQLMSPPPVRSSAIVMLGSPEDGGLQAILGELKSFGETPYAESDHKDLRKFSVAVGRTTTIDEQRSALTAIASGCLFVAVDQTPLPYFDATRDYVQLPLKSFGVTTVKTNEEFRYVDQALAAAVVAGLANNYNRRLSSIAEDARRIALSRATLGRITLNALGFAGRYAREPFLAHIDRFDAARDTYQWEGERELFYALLVTLTTQGALLEIGIGNGGTLSVLAAFANGRDVHAIDDFSYSHNGDQQAAVEKITSVFPINLIAAKSATVTWDKPLAFLHIDGGHDFIDIESDLQKFAPWIATGGVLAVDDFMTRDDQDGVGAAVDQFMEAQGARWTPVTCGPKVAFWRRVT